MKYNINNDLSKYFHKKLEKSELYKVKKDNLPNSEAYYQIPNMKNKKR